MSKSRIGKAGIASLAVTGLVSSGLLFTAGTANAVPGFEFDRIAGGDRFGTSALVAEQIGDGANAILANGQRGQFADALAANYLAGDLDAPVYLTRQNATPESISDQLEANEVESITIVGGEGAVSAAQAAALTADGYDVTRISGANRFETNAEIIEAVGGAPEDTALVATGLNFSDALAGGPLAENGHPLALASQNGVPDSVLAALETSGVDNAIIVGGENAVGAGAVSDLEDAGIDVVTRLSGTGRADTSVAVAEYGVANLGLTDTAVNLASGDIEGSGADALSGGVLTGQQGRPLLITQTVNNPSNAVRDYIEDNNDTLVEGTIFGGTAAVSADTQTELEELGQGEEQGNETIEVSPQEAVTLGGGEQREYTASDLDPTLDYRITLVDSENISEDENGIVSFAQNTPANGFANRGDVESDIVEVNGVITANPADSPSVGGISPAADGSIDFLVETDGEREDFVPVVYTDQGGTNTLLNIDADGEPTEPFGLGGEISVVEADDFTVTPLDAVRPYGTTQTVTIQLEQLGEDAPQAGENFTVVEEDDQSPARTVRTVTTDANGTATYDVTRTDPTPATAGDETNVELTITPEDATLGAVETVDIEFNDDAAAATDAEIVTPDEDDVNLTGSQEVVEAEVTDQFGNPVAGQTVQFEVGPTGVLGDTPTGTVINQTRTTNAQGIARLSYTNNGTAGTDLIEITVPGATPGAPAIATDDVTVEFSDGVASLDRVTGDDDDFATIGEAITAAVAGDTVTAVGEFTETVALNKDVTLTSDNADITGAVTVSGVGATLDGFTVDPAAGTTAISVTANNVTVSGNTVVDETEAIDVATATTGVVISGNTLTNNTLGLDVNTLNLSIDDNDFATDASTVAANDVYVDTADAPRSVAALNAIIAANNFAPAAGVEGQTIVPASSIPVAP